MISHLTTAYQRQDDFDRQQIRLCELALAGKPDTKAMEAAEAKFRAIQERYGQLQIDNPQAVAIVTIPEIFLRERRTYAWRIYVPPDQNVELTAYVDNRDSPPSTLFTPDSFTQLLPAGESIIQFVWTEHYFGKWGSFNSGPDRKAGVAVSINGDDFRWQSDRRRSVIAVVAERYPIQQTLFGNDDFAELSRVEPLSGRDTFHLVVRQAKSNATE